MSLALFADLLMMTKIFVKFYRKIFPQTHEDFFLQKIFDCDIMEKIFGGDKNVRIESRGNKFTGKNAGKIFVGDCAVCKTL